MTQRLLDAAHLEAQGGQAVCFLVQWILCLTVGPRTQSSFALPPNRHQMSSSLFINYLSGGQDCSFSWEERQ